jgi:hypothetical protein
MIWPFRKRKPKPIATDYIRENGYILTKRGRKRTTNYLIVMQGQVEVRQPIDWRQADYLEAHGVKRKYRL